MSHDHDEGRPDRFELRGPSCWRSRWRAQKISLEIGGTEAAPDPALEATMRRVVESWPEHQQRIAEFLRALAPGDHVPLEPASLGGFAAKSCGFDGKLFYQSIAAPDRDAPDQVEVILYTGEPDGYATYRVVLIDGRPVRVTAFAS
jgi:hypothetical protein